MVGHKLGEFAPTRTFRGHAGNKKTKETIREGTMGNRKKLRAEAIEEARSSMAGQFEQLSDFAP